jgi:hypothetical protein
VKWIAYIFGALFISLRLVPAAEVFPGRAYLEKLGKPEHRQIQFDDYKEPYLTCVTARHKKVPVQELTASVRDYLKRKSLSFRGRFSKTGSSVIDTKTLPLPEVSTTGRQLEEVEKCNREYCGVKLNTAEEKSIVEKAPDKLAAFHRLLIERVRSYLKDGTLLGYEERKDNASTLKEMIERTGFFSQVYPECAKFFSTPKGEIKNNLCRPVDSFVAEDLVQLSGSDKLKPVLRLGEFFEIPQKEGGVLFVEVIIYTNHFFDSSLRLIEALSMGDQNSAVILTDVVDIDELKKSSVIRFLYKGKMAAAVTEYQVEELDAILP